MKFTLYSKCMLISKEYFCSIPSYKILWQRVKADVPDSFHFPFQFIFQPFLPCSVLGHWLFGAILRAFLVHDLQLGLANGRHQQDTWGKRKQRSGCLSSRLHFYWVTSDWLHPSTEVHNACWVDFSYRYSLLILASDSCPCSFRYRDNTTTPRFLALGHFTILIGLFHVVNTPFFKLT